MTLLKAAVAPLLILTFSLSACERDSAGVPGPNSTEGCVNLSSEQTLNFEAAPVIPSLGGLLAYRGSDGRFAFVDPSLRHEILIFEDSGGFERSLGGEGDGPGEYDRITAVAFDSADSLWVLSRRGLRADLYGPDLEWARSMQLEMPVRRFAPLGDGTFVAVVASGSETEVELMDREGGLHPTSIVLPPVPPGALIPSMAELTQVTTNRADRFWVSQPYSYRIWEGDIDGGSRLLSDQAPPGFDEDYPGEVKKALLGMIDPGGSTILAIQYDAALDAIWVIAGVPESSLKASDLEGIEDPADIPPLLVSHVVEVLEVGGGEPLCTQRFDYLYIALNSALQYRVPEVTVLEVVRPRIR